MKKFFLSILLSLVCSNGIASGFYYNDPLELSLKGVLLKPYEKYSLDIKLHEKDKSIELFQISIDGKEKAIPASDFSGIVGLKTRTIVIGTSRAPTEFVESDHGTIMKFGNFEYLTVAIEYNSDNNCESGNSSLNITFTLSDLTHEISHYCESAR